MVLRVHRDPLFHFALIGIALFALDHARNPAPEPDSTEPLAVSAKIRSELSDQLAARSGKPPSESELQKAAEHWLEEEMLYREGLQLGLDRDDTLIRARVIEKMRFTLGHTIETPEPSEADLQAYQRDHADRYRGAVRYDFAHLVLTGEAPPQLEAAREYHGRSRENVRAVLGSELEAQLEQLTPGEWHTVSLEDTRHMLRLERVLDAAPSFEQLRDQLRADWKQDKQREATLQKLEALRKAYRVAGGDA